jgi:cephalosporin-C deacetylase
MRIFRTLLTTICLIGALAPLCRAQTLQVSNEKSSGIYIVNEPIRWHIQSVGKPAITSVHFVLKRGGLTVMQSGDLPLSATGTVLETKLDRPGTVLAEITSPDLKDAAGKPISALAGAVVAPEQIAPSAAPPADFDAFWKAKVEEISQVPLNPLLTEAAAERPGVSYWKVTLDNIHGTHVQGQLARPTEGSKFPAVLAVQYAGVYALQKPWVTDYAVKGWLALNIEAHDIPIDQPPEFYKHLGETSLSGYPAFGIADRETCYFLRMFLGCYQAARYLMQRPDWDGKTLVVIGASQGGMQALATAALVPQVTAAIADVPGGCDATGKDVGRAPGWPLSNGPTFKTDPAKVVETLRYFDGVNFAPRIHCPLLIDVGLVDMTVPAEGAIAAFNQAAGPKSLVIGPRTEHKSPNNIKAAYWQANNSWFNALLAGKPVPPQN